MQKLYICNISINLRRGFALSTFHCTCIQFIVRMHTYTYIVYIAVESTSMYMYRYLLPSLMPHTLSPVHTHPLPLHLPLPLRPTSPPPHLPPPSLSLPPSLPPQLHHYVCIWRRVCAVEGVGHKLAVLLKGPGWSLGKPRLGCRDEIPQVSLSHYKLLPSSNL